MLVTVSSDLLLIWVLLLGLKRRLGELNKDDLDGFSVALVAVKGSGAKVLLIAVFGRFLRVLNVFRKDSCSLLLRFFGRKRRGLLFDISTELLCFTDTTACSSALLASTASFSSLSIETGSACKRSCSMLIPV